MTGISPASLFSPRTVTALAFVEGEQAIAGGLVGAFERDEFRAAFEDDFLIADAGQRPSHPW